MLITSMTAPLPVVSRSPEEHERAGEGSEPAPGHPHFAPRSLQAGLFEDLERDDDERGYEDEPDTYEPQPQSRIVIRTGHPRRVDRPLVRFAPQHGARMGNCGNCGECTQSGACPRCGALVGLAPTRELLLTAATCPRCGGHGCPVCSYRGQV